MTNALQRLMTRRGRKALGALLLLLSLPFIVSGQDRNRSSQQPSTSNVDYNGQFVFTRIRYGWGWANWGFGRGGSWGHDYPRADLHLTRIVADLTTTNASLQGSNVFSLDDPAIFYHPLIYLSEPGFWTMTDSEAQNLRRHLLKGGFIIFDDFELDQWRNFEAQMKRVLPECRPIEVDVNHPIFHSFFDMKTIDFPHPMVNVRPTYYGYFEDDDPAKRMLAIVNYNADVAEYWEWSATGMFPVDLTNEAYKLGVNYVIYAMTH